MGNLDKPPITLHCFFNVFTIPLIGASMKKDGLLIETGFEPSTCFPFRISILLRSTVPSTLQSNDSFEPVSLRLITPEVCSQERNRTSLQGATRCHNLPSESNRPCTKPDYLIYLSKNLYKDIHSIPIFQMFYEKNLQFRVSLYDFFMGS
jgi:hypothetical protein